MHKRKTKLHQDNLRAAADDARQAGRLLDEDRNDEAKELLLKMRQWARQNGLPHANLSWMLAIANDNLGELIEAATHIQETIEVAPLEPQHWRSYDVIMKRLRASLHDEELEPTDPKIPALYDALREAGEVSPECHVVMARYHHASGNTEEALRMLDAVATLAPTCMEGRRLRTEIARDVGDPSLVAELEAEEKLVDGETLQPTQPKAYA